MNSQTILEVSVLFGVCLASILSIFPVYLRIKKKPNELLKHLLKIIICCSIFIFFLGSMFLFRSLSNSEPENLFYLYFSRLSFGLFVFWLSIMFLLTWSFKNITFLHEPDPIIRKLMIIAAYLIGFLGILAVVPTFTILEIIVPVLLGVYIIIIHLPFTIDAFKMIKLMEKPVYKQAFFGIGLMAVSYILLFTSIMVNIFLAGGVLNENFHLTIFDCIFIGSGFIGAYLGYIKPGGKIRD